MILWFTAVVTLLLDQGIKWVVSSTIPLFGSIPVWPGILYLTHVRNQGGAFGVLGGHTELLIGAAVVLLVVAIAGHRAITRAGHAIPAGLIIGGALGNLVDRLQFGAVIDFLDFKIWPVFNVADVAIVIGVGLVLISELRPRPE